MPQVGWIWRKERWSHDDLMALAEKHPLDFPYDPEMLDAMFTHYERDFLSPTMLNGCPRETALKRLVPYYEHVRNAWTRFRGTLGHLLMETTRLKLPGVVREERYSVRVNLDGHDYVLRGKPDKYVIHHKILVDYKTVEEMVDLDTDKGQRKLDGWTTQLSLYRWLLHQNGIKIEQAQISAIHMHEPARIEVPLWSLEKTESYVRARLPLFKDVFECTLDDLPPVLEASDPMSWLCRSTWCPVSYQCRQYAEIEEARRRMAEPFDPN